MKEKKTTKTNHQTGWHKRVKNPTTNYPMDTHKDFCKRCLKINGLCPMTNSMAPHKGCNV